jgi:hypothetical protein
MVKPLKRFPALHATAVGRAALLRLSFEVNPSVVRTPAATAAAVADLARAAHTATCSVSGSSCILLLVSGCC